MRLFFALWPDVDERAHTAKAAAALSLAGGVRFVPCENYHLTLAFVGEVEESRLELLRQIGREQRSTACTVPFHGYEYWPHSRVVVAVASEMPSALLDLWATLHRDLARQPALDSHRDRVSPRAPPHAGLRGHVTLVRKVAQPPVLNAMPPFVWSARAFSLIRSEIGGAQSVYTVVDTWQLLDERRETTEISANSTHMR